MKRVILIYLFSLFCSYTFGINLDVATYNFYGTTPFTELYLRIDARSVEWKSNKTNKEAGVNLLLMISGPDGNIAAYDKFTLTSSTIDSTYDFLDVKRLKLHSGEYLVKIEAIDVNDSSNKIELEQKLIVEEANIEFMVSDILLLGKLKADSTNNALVRNGWYMEPLTYHFSGPAHLQLDAYIEIYRPSSANTDDLFLQYVIMEGTTKNINAKSLLSKFKKLSGKNIEPIVVSFPLQTIKSGDYHLLVNIVNKEKNILATRRVDFVKSNPEADIAYLENYNESLENSFVLKILPEEMDYILKAHLPITDQHQVSTLGELLRSNKIKSQRQFIFQYWKAKAPTNPEEGYNKYMEVAEAVNKKFYSNVGYGFQSDRGHIFLKYGKPSNVLAVDTEVDAPPYEIWYYSYIPQARQTNVRFLFYNPTLAHNDFRLLHSTCIGEKVNVAWETELYKSVPDQRLGNAIDATQVSENFNRNARRYFNEY